MPNHLASMSGALAVRPLPMMTLTNWRCLLKHYTLLSKCNSKWITNVENYALSFFDNPPTGESKSIHTGHSLFKDYSANRRSPFCDDDDVVNKNMLTKNKCWMCAPQIHQYLHLVKIYNFVWTFGNLISHLKRFKVC